ncbi:MAG: hypothetical protein AABZ60_00250 [Planctomycetota bacterium]
MSDIATQKESYADFSIIYKYCEQKRTNDEQIRKINLQVEELTDSVNKYKGKLARREEAIMALTKEKEEVVRELAETKKRLETMTARVKEVSDELGQTKAIVEQLDPKHKHH